MFYLYKVVTVNSIHGKVEVHAWLHYTTWYRNTYGHCECGVEIAGIMCHEDEENVNNYEKYLTITLNVQKSKYEQ